MEKLEQYKVIYNAFKDTLNRQIPSKEEDYPDWYKDRMDKCAKCKYSTKNIPMSMLPVGGLMLGKTLGKDRCSICTCFIRQKCWSKTEECAMGETESRPVFLTTEYLSKGWPKEDAPLWDRLELLTMKSDLFDFIVPEGKKGDYRLDLTEDGGAFCLHIKTVEAVNPEFAFTLKAKKDIRLKNIGTSCGCIAQNVAFMEDRKIYADVKINLVEWEPGNYQRDMRFHYVLADALDKEENVAVVFKITVLGNPDTGEKERLRAEHREAVAKARAEHEARRKAEEEGRKAKATKDEEEGDGVQ